MRLISFSSLMASVMSPLIRSFPDMKARVGFSFPETDTAVTMETTPLRVWWQRHQGNRLSVISTSRTSPAAQRFLCVSTAVQDLPRSDSLLGHKTSQNDIQILVLSEILQRRSQDSTLYQRYHGDGSPANILVKSLESSVMTTSALTGGSPWPALPEPLFKSRNHTPPCSPYMDTNTLMTPMYALYGHKHINDTPPCTPYMDIILSFLLPDRSNW